MSDHIIISNISDDPFAIDIGHMCGQREDISDIISMKVYANTEFCPRFISDEQDMDHIGSHLDGKTVMIVDDDMRSVYSLPNRFRHARTRRHAARETAARSFALSSKASRGSVKLNVLPWSTVERTSSRPPWASTRPRPP